MWEATFPIRRKIIKAFLFCFIAVLVFAVASLQIHLQIGHKLKLVEISDDLVNDILEIRRNEKNFFLYQRTSSIHEALLYVNRVERLYLANQKKLSKKTNNLYRQRFLGQLHDYREILFALESSVLEGSVEATKRIAESERELRRLGQGILEMAENRRKNERGAIDRLRRQAIYLFVISMGVFLVLGILVAFHVSRQLVNPLLNLQETMLRIALGDFTPIPESRGRSEEFRPLFSAFNRMIHELEDHQEQLIQSRKIAAIGTLTSGIAHELNNPINNIVLTVESLKEEFHELEPDEIAEMLQDILSQSERASEIVRNLLDFSRSEQPKLESISISSVIQDTLRLVRNQITLSHINCETTIPTQFPMVYGEYKSLQQVFLNLFINAIQAMPAGGVLKVGASVSQDGKWVEIEVSDTGVGIDPKDLPHIFDPFYTTKEVGKGTGLGLSVSYGIIQKHGGRIEVSSRKDLGTTFTVILPVQAEDEEALVEDGVVYADRRSG